MAPGAGEEVRPGVESLFLVGDGVEIARRRKLCPPGQIVEVWPDLYAAGDFWLGASSKRALDGAGPPLRPKLSVPATAVPIYYGPRLDDVPSLPSEESLQSRVLSAHGIAVAWITFDQFGQRNQYEPQSPVDPVFYLRRPSGSVAHVWRLFRTKREAHVYMAEYYGKDSEGRDWAEALSVGTFDDLLARHGQRG
jgi:hypothetical protein